MAIEFDDDNEQNLKQLEIWIEKQSENVHIAIAHRVRLRVAPSNVFAGYKHLSLDSIDFTFSAMRCFLMTSLTIRWPNNNSILRSVKSANSTGYFNFRFFSPFAAAFSVFSDISALSYIPIDLFSAESWHSVERDITFLEESGKSAKELLAQPLFINAGYDERLEWSKEDLAMLDAFGKDNPEYEFWVRCIQSSYYGKGLYGATRSSAEWDMLKKIGLLGNDIWEEGAGKVAQEIREIEGAFRGARQPLDAEADKDINTQASNQEVIAVARGVLEDRDNAIENLDSFSDAINIVIHDYKNRTNNLPEAILLLDDISSISKRLSNGVKRFSENDVSGEIAELRNKIESLEKENEAIKLELAESQDAQDSVFWESYKKEMGAEFAKKTMSVASFTAKCGVGYLFAKGIITVESKTFILDILKLFMKA